MSDGERIARNEQAISDIRDDITEMRSYQLADHHRLREVEGAVSLMLEAQKQARRAEARQYRRVELRMQVLTIVIGIAAVVSPLAAIILSGK